MSDKDIEKAMITNEEMASLRSWVFGDQDQEKEWKEMVEASKRQIELTSGYVSDHTILFAYNKIVNLERLLAAKDTRIAEFEQIIIDTDRYTIEHKANCACGYSPTNACDCGALQLMNKISEVKKGREG